MRLFSATCSSTASSGNYICYRLEDGLLHPLRYTEKQIAHLTDFSERQAIRALASANITLEMRTNSRHMGLDLSFLPGSSRESGAVDFLINDTFAKSFHFKEAANYNIDINLDGNMNKVTIYLPWSYQTKIARITLDDNCMVWKTAKKPKSIICMGDSITQGYMADNPTQTYVGRLSTHLDAEVINQGNGGYFLDYELLDEFINIKPSLVTFAYGTNDYSRNGNPEVIRDNLDDFLDKLTEIFTKTPVLCITAPYRGSEKHFNRESIIGWGYDKLREIFHEVCSKYSQVTVIDDPVPHDEACFFTDYTHPTALGFEHYFNNIYPTVKELLG